MADTPSREELLALADRLDVSLLGNAVRADVQTASDIIRRLAAKPSDEGVREALKPFAEAADYYDDANLSPGEHPWRDDHPANPIFKVGQLRTARAALSPGEPKP